MEQQGNNDHVIEVQHLTTRLGGELIHDDINLVMKKGEILSLVGGSGSGKSTLLRVILRLIVPSAGTIRVLNHDLASTTALQLQALRRRMGVMFQNGALFSSLSVLENVRLPLLEHTSISKKTGTALARMKIRLVDLPADAADKLPSELSGGMRKRAALARALALDPELIFLDEPTSGLDPIGAAGLDEVILRLHRALHISILMVTHDLHSLWKLADTIAILGSGKLVAVGAKEDVVQREDPVIKNFFHGERGRMLLEK